MRINTIGIAHTATPTPHETPDDPPTDDPPTDDLPTDDLPTDD
jgi:hypothetical protein